MFGLFGKKRSPEEIIASQGGASHQGKPGESVRITGGRSGSGLYNPQQSGLASQNYNVMDNGRLVIQPGVEEYKWNDRLKRYDAIPGMGRGYLLVDSIKAEEDEEEKKGGGGVGGGEGSLPTGYRPDPLMSKGPMIPGTYFGGGVHENTGILGVPPGSQNWKPTGGVLNPYADPYQFYVDLPPIQMDEDRPYVIPTLGVLA